LPYVLILEDDAVLVGGFAERLNTAMKELPDDWNALWLNGTEVKKGIDIGKHLKKVREMWGTFGYVINENFYDLAIEGLKKEVSSADGFFTSVQRKNQVFATKHPLVKHLEGFSEIAGETVSRYKHLA